MRLLHKLEGFIVAGPGGAYSRYIMEAITNGDTMYLLIEKKPDSGAVVYVARALLQEGVAGSVEEAARMARSGKVTFDQKAKDRIERTAARLNGFDCVRASIREQ